MSFSRVLRFLSKSRRFIGKVLLPFLLDFAILLVIINWWCVFRKYGFLLPFSLALLLRWKRFDRLLPTRIVYLLLCFLFLDPFFLGLFPLYAMRPGALAFAILTIPACILWIVRKRMISMRSVVASFVPAYLVVCYFFWDVTRPTTPEECAAITRKTGIERLVDASQDGRGLPTYLVSRPSKGDLLFVYRDTFYLLRDKIRAERFDWTSRTLQPIPITTQSIGMYYDEPTDQIISVNVNENDPDHPKTLVVLDSDFVPQAVLDFPKGKMDDYDAYMMPLGDRIAIHTEGDLFFFDPRTLELDFAYDEAGMKLGRRGCKLPWETGFFPDPPFRYLVSGGISPLLHLILRPDNVCLFDLRDHKLLGKFRAPWTGVFDVALVPERKEILATSMYQDKVWVLSSEDLQIVRTLKVAPCIRPIAYDARKQLGYTAQTYTGFLIGFDIMTGEIRERIYVGKNSRKIYSLGDKGIIVLSGCGIFWLP